MAGLTDNVGLILRIKSDASEAVKDLNKVQSEIKGVGAAGATAAGGIASMINPATIAAAAITGIGVAAAVGAKTLFGLTEAAADFGSEIFDATQKTNLGAEAISALRYAAEQSGVSFDKITGSLSKFTVLLGQASLDNEKAQKTLADFGITTTNTQKALEQAITKIASYTDHNQAAAASAILFKDRTGDVLNVIRSLNGNLPATIEKLRGLGLVMSDEDAKAADEFGDQMDTLTKQLSAAGRMIGFELMPTFLNMATTISNWLSANKGEIRSWASFISDQLYGVIDLWGQLKESIMAVQMLKAGISLETTLGVVDTLGKARIRAGKQRDNPLVGGEATLGDNVPNVADALPTPRRSAGGSDAKAKRDNAAREEEERLRRAFQDRVEQLQRFFAESEAALDRQLSEFAVKVAAGAESELAFEEKKRAAAELTATRRLGMLNGQLEAARKYGQETVEIESRIAIQRDKIDEVRNTNQSGRLKEQTEAEKKADEERTKRGEAQFEREMREFDEKIQKAKELNDLLVSPGLEKPKDVFDVPQADDYDFGLANTWQTFRDSILGDGPTIGAALTTIKDIGVDAFQSMAQGIGSMVEAWVLYGSAGPQAMKKMVASVLAGVAAQSAVLAIFELAKGFAALWLNPKEAADHFIAAALFGSIATGAALGGRAVAGDSFSQSTANGGGGGGSSDGLSDQDKGQNSYTTPFRGYGGQSGGIGARLTGAIVQLEETTMQLATKIKGFSPGDVLGMGADENPRAIRGALESELSNDVGTTGAMMRGLGFAT